MDAVTQFDTQMVGSLPVITDYLDRLTLGDAVNDAVPWEGVSKKKRVPCWNWTILDLRTVNATVHEQL